LGRVFTMFIILGGVGTAFYAFTRMAEIVYEGAINRLWRRKRMEKKIQGLKDHYIICGHGRIGRIVRETLEAEKLPFVVIDKREEALQELQGRSRVLYIRGDATQEEILTRAGIKRAKAFAALLPTDADNLYLVMTVKLIHPSLYVLSKAVDEEGERKILQIGANKTVNPNRIGGQRIAQGLIRPTVVEFMDLIIRRKELSLSMEEFSVKKGSRIVRRTIAQCDIRRKANVIVVAVKKPGEDIKFNPSPDTLVEPGDTLLVIGLPDDINTFNRVYLEGGG